MNKKTTITALLATGMLSAGGFGLYQLGLKNGMTHAMMAAPTETKGSPTDIRIDPSTWGIPEGEAATRRHIETGIKGGDVDPVTGRSVLHYHDPMVPGKKFEAPGKSPFMDMMLVPAYAGAQGADSGTVSVSSRIQQWAPWPGMNAVNTWCKRAPPALLKSSTCVRCWIKSAKGSRCWTSMCRIGWRCRRTI
jgi:membrane fusion protein, copper/silver efflux system